MNGNNNRHFAKRYLKPKHLLWCAYFILVVALSAVLILSSRLNFGQQKDFVLYQLIGIPRGLALQLLLWPGVVLLAYETLAIGIGPTASRSRILDGDQVSMERWGLHSG